MRNRDIRRLAEPRDGDNELAQVRRVMLRDDIDTAKIFGRIRGTALTLGASAIIGDTLTHGSEVSVAGLFFLAAAAKFNSFVRFADGEVQQTVAVLQNMDVAREHAQKDAQATLPAPTEAPLPIEAPPQQPEA